MFVPYVLFTQRDDKGFAHPERIEKLVKNYSQFVSFPIYTWQEKGFTKEVRISDCIYNVFSYSGASLLSLALCYFLWVLQTQVILPCT